MLKTLFPALMLCLGTGVVAAQQPTPYVPGEHWTMPFIEHLITTGAIIDPDPMTRPLTQGAVRAALLRADTTRMDSSTRELVADMLREFPERTASPGYQFDGYLGFGAQTHGRRNPLRSGGVGLGGPIGHYDASVTMGNFVMSGSTTWNRQLRGDPEYTGELPTVPVRSMGYISYQFEYGEFFWGGMSHNWGPPVEPGFLISNSPYSYEHFSMRLGTDRLSIDMTAATLDNVDDRFGVTNNRYLMAHRLIFRATPRLTLGFVESVLIFGRGARFSPWYLNPLRVAWRATDEEAGDSDTNISFGFDVAYRLDGLNLFGSFLMDDLRAGGTGEPSAYGVTLGMRGGLGGSAGLTAYYTVVSSLAYAASSLQPPDVYVRRNIGIGRNFSDYDQFTVKLGIVPLRAVLIEPEITLLRQGEGNFLDTFPPTSLWDVWPLLHLGVVERTWRFAVSGAHNINSRGTINWGAGVHVIDNVAHVSGIDATRFVGSLSVRIHGEERDFWWWLPFNW